VTPALVAALEFDRSRKMRALAVPVGLVGTAVVLYVILYVFAFPTSKSYYELGPHVLARIPQQLGAFLYLGSRDRTSSPLPGPVCSPWSSLS